MFQRIGHKTTEESYLIVSYLITTVVALIFMGHCSASTHGDWINIKLQSYQYRNFHCGDKTILRPPFFHNAIGFPILVRRHLYIKSGPTTWSSPYLQMPNSALLWRHDECDGVSIHQLLDCLLNRLFRRLSKNTSELRVTSLCEGNSPVTGEFPTQRTSNAEMFPFDDVIMDKVFAVIPPAFKMADIMASQILFIINSCNGLPLFGAKPLHWNRNVSFT